MSKKDLIPPVGDKAEKRRFGSFMPVVVSALSLCVALTSLFISYKNYQHSQTEKLSVWVFPKSSNNSASLTTLSSGSYLYVFWDVLFTNIGDRPLTIVRYDIREQLSKGQGASIFATFYDEGDNEILLPITLQPAESKLVRANIPLRPARSALEILDEELDSDESSWDQVTLALFWKNIDIYGNKFKLVQLPGEELWVNILEPPMRQQQFRFTFATGRGTEFGADASLYGRTATQILGR